MTIKGLFEAVNFVYRFMTKLALFVLALLFLAFCVRENARQQELEKFHFAPSNFPQEPDFTIRSL